MPKTPQSFQYLHNVIAERMRLFDHLNKLLQVVVDFFSIEHGVKGKQVFLQVQIEVSLKIGESDRVFKGKSLESGSIGALLNTDVGVKVEDDGGDFLVDDGIEVGVGACAKVEHSVEDPSDISFQEPAVATSLYEPTEFFKGIPLDELANVDVVVVIDERDDYLEETSGIEQIWGAYNIIGLSDVVFVVLVHHRLNLFLGVLEDDGLIVIVLHDLEDEDLVCLESLPIEVD